MQAKILFPVLTVFPHFSTSRISKIIIKEHIVPRANTDFIAQLVKNGFTKLTSYAIISLLVIKTEKLLVFFVQMVTSTIKADPAFSITWVFIREKSFVFVKFARLSFSGKRILNNKRHCPLLNYLTSIHFARSHSEGRVIGEYTLKLSQKVKHIIIKSNNM